MKKSFTNSTICIILLITLTSSAFLQKEDPKNVAPHIMQYEIYPYNPEAPKESIKICGNARFTVLTSRLIRMEQNSNKTFVDDPTIAIVQRNLQTPQFTSTIDQNTLKITTQNLELTYDCTKNFAPESLSIKGIGHFQNDFKGTWAYGQVDSGNLYGTVRTLDGYQLKTLNCSLIPEDDRHCEMGVISKDGWVVYDDTENYLIGENDWVTGQNPNEQDLYFFGHGVDFKGAMKDFIQVAGSVPVPPKYSFGIWWTRWLDYNDRDLQAIFDLHKKTSIPMDVCVLDMNWHKKNGWGGYTFDPNLFPNPNDTMSWIHSQGPRVSMNLHDADGVKPYDDRFVNLCNALGLDPKITPEIPNQICSSLKYAHGLEDLVVKPLEDMGVDFWWIDWQQGESIQGGCPGKRYNPTIQLNRLRDTDGKRRNSEASNSTQKRRINFARWGGMGNHRYQVGFSGDVPKLDWENLALQPFMSAVAGNVGFGYWSHDITGPGSDMELYTRWTQWGVLSSIMRFHERGMSSGECAENVYPDPPGGSPLKQCSQWTAFDAPYTTVDTIRDLLEFRSALVPYIYTSAVDTFLSGTPFLRALYYDYPNSEMAYQALTLDGKMSQYMLGESMMICPIVSPIDPTTNMVMDKKIWIPDGNWFEINSGEYFSGEQWYNRSWDLTEIPTFVKAGSIIPKRPSSDKFVLSRAQLDYSEIQFDVYPGSDSPNNTLLLYEDDGLTMGYLDRQYAFMNVTSYYRDLTYINLTIVERVVSPWESPKPKTFTVRFMQNFPAQKVYFVTAKSVQPVEIPFSRFDWNINTWNYDSEELCITVRLPQVQADELPLTLVVEGNFAASSKLQGYKGVLRHANMAKSNLDITHTTPSSTSVQDPALIQVASYGEQLAHNGAPENFFAFTQLVFKLPDLFADAYKSIEDIAKQQQLPAMQKRLSYSLELLKNTILYED